MRHNSDATDAITTRKLPEPEAGTGAVDNSPKPTSELAEMLGKNTTLKGVLIALLVVVALASAIPAGNHFSSPEAYQNTIASLDEKKVVVTSLMGISVATSAAITAIPGDVGTPIAEQLANLSGDFLIILTAIYLEKFLLTTFGFAAFRILIPLGCILAIAALLMIRKTGTSSTLARISAKVLVFAVMIAIVVPASIFISDKMEQTHNVSVTNMLESIEEESAVVESEVEAAPQQEEDKGLLEGLTSGAEELFTGAAEKIAGTLKYGTDQAVSLLSQLTDSLALLIVTSCVIPILVLVLLLWLMKLILGVNIDSALGILKPKAMKGFGRR